MHQIPITKLFAMLERYNGMDTPNVKTQDEAPIAPDPLNSDDPKVREAAQALLAAKSCASQAA